MKTILLMIILCKNVIGNNEESNEKYIDLLPEEEKQEFLNRIARRILEEIKSKDTPNEPHVDITDDQLDAHDAFVQEILKEETDNFKNEKKQFESKEANENDRIETNDDIRNEHDKIDSNTGDKEDLIDLTLREGKRQKRKNNDGEFEKETTTEISYDVIPVKTIYDQFENDDNKVEVAQIDNSTNKGEENISTLEKEQEKNVHDEDNINIINDIRNSSNSIMSNNVLMNDSINASDKIENIENLRKSFHNKLELGTTDMVDFEPSSNENSTTASNINEETTSLPTTIVSEEVTESASNDENIWVSTQKIYDEENEKSKEEQEEQAKTVKHNNMKSNVITDKITETMTTNLTDFIDSSKDKSTNTEINNVTSSDSHKLKDKFLRRDSDEHKDIKTERSAIEIVKSAAKSTIESENISLSTIDNNSHSQSVIEFTTENQLEIIEKLSVAESASTKNERLEIITNVANGGKENIHVTESGNVLKSEDLQNGEQNTKKEMMKNDKTILRGRLDSIDISQIDENENVQKFGDDSNKIKVYEVFEVDDDQPQFITVRKVQQNEYPLYVPVYNYAPDNAYYRPYNKFGPNIEDQNLVGPKTFRIEDPEQFHSQSARNSFSGYNYNKKKDSFDKNKRNTKQSYIKQVIKNQKPKPKFLKKVTKNVYNQEIHYNPDDYADLDYYFGRVLRTGKKYRNNNGNKNNYRNYLPDSNEYEHPLNILHKSDTIKDHIRAVRNILYLQKQFGYVPQVNDRAFRKTDKYFRKGGHRKRRQKYNISMDYYFDRSHEVNNNNEVFSLKKSKLKYSINSNIVPLTPKPFHFEKGLETLHKKQELEVDNNNESINTEINNVPFKRLFEAIIVVLKDLIKVKNENLLKYNWLKTTVNIQAALRKLLDLIKELKSGENLHPKDIELLKYTIYLFTSSKQGLMKNNINIIKDTKMLRAKKIKNSTKTEKITKIKVPIHLWKKSMSGRRKGVELKEQLNLLSDFEDTLHKLLFHLKDLHDTIKHISIITEYKNQNWLEDINTLYLEKGDKKNLAKVILHLSLSRLLDLIEESSTRGVEDNFRIFIKKNREDVKKIREESSFVLNVLKELSSLNEP